MNIEYVIRDEKETDFTAITEVTIDAFKTLEVSQHTEQFIITELRNANDLTVSLVAESNDGVIGHISFSPIMISNGPKNWFGLGPVSVFPKYQNKGIGSALIKEGLSRLKRFNAGGCCLVGHPEYYQRFGFSNSSNLVLKGVPSEIFFSLSFEGEIPHGEVSFHGAFIKDYSQSGSLVD